MPRNSSGTYTLVAGNPVVPNTLIETTWANPTLGDVASALTDSLDRFGRGGMLAPFRVTDGTVTAPSLAFASETTLGLFRPSAGTLAIAVGGISRFILTAALLTISVPTTFTGAVTFSGGFAGPVLFPDGTAPLPSISFVNSPTTGFYRIGANILGIAIAGVEKWRVDASGRLAGNGAAQATRLSATAVTPSLQLGDTTLGGASVGVFEWNVSATAVGNFLFAKSRGAAIGTQTIVANNDLLGRVSGAGSDGVQFTEAARIQFVVDGTPGVNDMPGRIEFLTTADGASAPALALTIASDNLATFAGAVTIAGLLTGTTASFVTSATVPQVLINRTGATTNAGIGYQNTSGTVYAGHGAINNFSIGASANLSSTAWFHSGALGLQQAGLGWFNGAGQGILAVQDGAGSGATVNTSADVLVIDCGATGGMSILTPNTGIGLIYFGDPQSSSQGRINYTHSTDTMGIYAGNAQCMLITDVLVSMASGCELSLDTAGPTTATSAGFRGLPSNPRSAAYTLVINDAGKHIYHPTTDATARIWTIPANGTVAFPIGTAVTFINDAGAGVITIAITTDTLVLAPSGATGSRTLAANGIATAVKVTATRWQISGTNLS